MGGLFSLSSTFTFPLPWLPVDLLVRERREVQDPADCSTASRLEGSWQRTCTAVQRQCQGPLSRSAHEIADCARSLAGQACVAAGRRTACKTTRWKHVGGMSCEQHGLTLARSSGR